MLLALLPAQKDHQLSSSQKAQRLQSQRHPGTPLPTFSVVQVVARGMMKMPTRRPFTEEHRLPDLLDLPAHLQSIKDLHHQMQPKAHHLLRVLQDRLMHPQPMLALEPRFLPLPLHRAANRI